MQKRAERTKITCPRSQLANGGIRPNSHCPQVPQNEPTPIQHVSLQGTELRNVSAANRLTLAVLRLRGTLRGACPPVLEVPREEGRRWPTGQLAQSPGREREGAQSRERDGDWQPAGPGPALPGPALSLDARLGVDTRLWAKVLFTALYSLIFVLGTAGNALSVARGAEGAGPGPWGACAATCSAWRSPPCCCCWSACPWSSTTSCGSITPWVFGDLGCRAYYFVRELCAYATVAQRGQPERRALPGRVPAPARQKPADLRKTRCLSIIWAACSGPGLAHGRHHGAEARAGDGGRGPGARPRARAPCW